MTQLDLFPHSTPKGRAMAAYLAARDGEPILLGARQVRRSDRIVTQSVVVMPDGQLRTSCEARH